MWNLNKVVKNTTEKEDELKLSSTNKNEVENKNEQNSAESQGIVLVTEKRTEASSIQNKNITEIKENSNYLKIETPEDLDDWIESDPDQRNMLFKPHPTSKIFEQCE